METNRKCRSTLFSSYVRRRIGICRPCEKNNFLLG